MSAASAGVPVVGEPRVAATSTAIAPADALAVPVDTVVDALAALAGARSPADVAGACLPPLMRLAGVRATAVVQRDGDVAVVLASAGYGCDAMAPGSTIPLDAGLPVTEAVRTGRRVAHGSGPGWLALPAGRRRPGALLLSLHAAPPADARDLARLDRLAGALGDALDRTARAERAALELTRVVAGLRSHCPSDRRLDVAVRIRPAHGPVGGDRVLALSDERDGSWLVVADVCGSDIAAAVVAHGVQTAVAAVAGHADGPAQLLEALDRALGPIVAAGSFVTACAVHLAGDRLRVATAGHPAPVLLCGGRARTVDVDPGHPLVLECGSAEARPEAACRLPEGTTVLLHSDGLVERRSTCGSVLLLDPVHLAAGLRLDDLEAAADRLLAAADGQAAQMDDVSLLLARPRRG